MGFRQFLFKYFCSTLFKLAQSTVDSKLYINVAIFSQAQIHIFPKMIFFRLDFPTGLAGRVGLTLILLRSINSMGWLSKLQSTETGTSRTWSKCSSNFTNPVMRVSVNQWTFSLFHKSEFCPPGNWLRVPVKSSRAFPQSMEEEQGMEAWKSRTSRILESNRRWQISRTGLRQGELSHRL